MIGMQMMMPQRPQHQLNQSHQIHYAHYRLNITLKKKFFLLFIIYRLRIHSTTFKNGRETGPMIKRRNGKSEVMEV